MSERSNIEENTFITIKDEVGRDHIPYPSSGKSYVFLRSNTSDPSTIEVHCNDIINMFDVDNSLKNEKCLVLIVDVGADYGIRSTDYGIRSTNYGIRSTISMHYLWKLFIELNLDVVKMPPRIADSILWSICGDF